MRDHTRRETLFGVATLGAVALAGCVSEESDDPGDGTGGDDDDDQAGSGNESDQTEDEDSITDDVDVSIVDEHFEAETVAPSSGGPDEPDGLLAVTVEDDTIVVEGVRPANSPDYEGVLHDSSTKGPELRFAVDLEKREQEGATPEPTAEVQYKAEFTLDNADAIQAIQVDHTEAGRHVAPWDSDEETFDVEDDGLADGDPDDEDGIEDTTFTHVQVNSGTQRDEATVERDDGVVTIEGKYPLSTPHYMTYLDDVRLDDELVVEVGARSTTDDEAEAQPLANAEYEAEIVLTDDIAVPTVRVVHEDGNEHVFD